ncbi:acyl CoA binding protein-domain-containing protein [Geopyxis carbonaria]|nr:acyl CoA binding protein-domain-containing protein [Geopyxis carbonaria]
MSDSVDRVFAHALQTVRKIPRTGSARPPPEARLTLYGLYKQSMEGDVEGVMERPPLEKSESLDGRVAVVDEARKSEIEKWDAWNTQKGLSKTEAKRQYIGTLIETMHKYASATPEARELVAELEFVWDQIRSNVPSTISTLTPDEDGVLGLGLVSPNPYGEEVLPSAGEETGAELQTPREKAWRGRVEKALAKMTTEVAALREQLESRRIRERRGTVTRLGVWVLKIVWMLCKHLAVETIFWGLVFLWMRRRGDRRAEDALKLVMRFVRERLREMRVGRTRKPSS